MRTHWPAVAFLAVTGVLVSCSSAPLSAAPPLEPLPTPTGCVTSQPAATDVDLEVVSTVYGTTERVRVHLTPCTQPISGPLPVLYLLHGAGADETQWPDVEILVAIDNAVTCNQFPPAVIVIPDAAAGYRDLERTDDFAAHLLEEIEPAVADIAPIDTTRRAIGGISRGGGIALRVAGANPSEFITVGAHSPIPAPDAALESVAANGLAVYLDVGADDSLADGVDVMAQLLINLGSDPAFDVGPGGHDRSYWRSKASDYARFYGEALS